MNRSLLVALGVGGAVILAVIILATGGAGPPGSEDATGDVVVSEGERAPEDVGIADVEEATVTRDGQSLVFVARMATDIPRRVRGGSLEFRWDLSENGTDTWLVSATVNISVSAAITSQRTTYGSSTIDDTLPGSVEVDGNTLTLRVDAARIEGFPAAFDWRLRTTLDADRSDPASATGSDTAPDAGAGTVDG